MTQTAGIFATLDTLTARDLMRQGVETIHVGASLREAVDRFLTGPSRHLIVVDEDGGCAGVLGPRHIAQARYLDPRSDPDIPVRDLGSAPWIALGPDDDLRTCAQMLIEHDLDAIPVLDAQRRVLGLITAHDVARAVADTPRSTRPRWEE